MPRKPKKNPAAVALGRLGGMKRSPGKGFGSLTPAGRTANAKKAAAKRWGTAEAGGGRQ